MASYEISISTKEAKDKLDNLKADIKTTIEEIKATSLASIDLDAKFKEGTIQKLKDELDSINDLTLKIDAAITEESKKALDEEIAEIRSNLTSDTLYLDISIDQINDLDTQFQAIKTNISQIIKDISSKITVSRISESLAPIAKRLSEIDTFFAGLMTKIDEINSKEIEIKPKISEKAARGAETRFKYLHKTLNRIAKNSNLLDPTSKHIISLNRFAERIARVEDTLDKMRTDYDIILKASLNTKDVDAYIKEDKITNISVNYIDNAKSRQDLQKLTADINTTVKIDDDSLKKAINVMSDKVAGIKAVIESPLKLSLDSTGLKANLAHTEANLRDSIVKMQAILKSLASVDALVAIKNSEEVQKRTAQSTTKNVETKANTGFVAPPSQQITGYNKPFFNSSVMQALREVRTSPSIIKVPAPIVNVPAPIVNVEIPKESKQGNYTQFQPTNLKNYLQYTPYPKVFITEKGDPSHHVEYMDMYIQKFRRAAGQFTDSLIVITKNIDNPKLQDFLIKYKEFTIAHAGATGLGGSKLEPGVSTPDVLFAGLKQLIAKGFPVNQIVGRIDPIIPSENGVKIAEQMFDQFVAIGIKRIRFSIMDNYKNTNHLMPFEQEAGRKGNIHAPKEFQAIVFNALIKKADELGVTLEACGERLADSFKEGLWKGCSSNTDRQILGLSNILENIGKQRPECLCGQGKTEILPDKTKTECPNECAYCYWRTTQPKVDVGEPNKFLQNVYDRNQRLMPNIKSSQITPTETKSLQSDSSVIDIPKTITPHGISEPEKIKKAFDDDYLNNLVGALREQTKKGFDKPFKTLNDFVTSLGIAPINKMKKQEVVDPSGNQHTMSYSVTDGKSLVKINQDYIEKQDFKIDRVVRDLAHEFGHHVYMNLTDANKKEIDAFFKVVQKTDGIDKRYRVGDQVEEYFAEMFARGVVKPFGEKESFISKEESNLFNKITDVMANNFKPLEKVLNVFTGSKKTEDMYEGKTIIGISSEDSNVLSRLLAPSERTRANFKVNKRTNEDTAITKYIQDYSKDIMPHKAEIKKIIYKLLSQTSSDAADVVLTCFEETGEFCHRALAASMLAKVFPDLVKNKGEILLGKDVPMDLTQNIKDAKGQIIPASLPKDIAYNIVNPVTVRPNTREPEYIYKEVKEPVQRASEIQTYTGVGSREVPEDIADLMEKVGFWKALEGHFLRTGDAQGTDRAFTRGALQGGGQFRVYTENDTTQESIAIARSIHRPEHWNNIAKYQWSLGKVGRNPFQVLGDKLDDVTDELITWTPNAAKTADVAMGVNANTGGTGTAIALADKHGVKVWNLADEADRAYWEKWVRDMEEQYKAVPNRERWREETRGGLFLTQHLSDDYQNVWNKKGDKKGSAIIDFLKQTGRAGEDINMLQSLEKDLSDFLLNGNMKDVVIGYAYKNMKPILENILLKIYGTDRNLRESNVKLEDMSYKFYELGAGASQADKKRYMKEHDEAIKARNIKKYDFMEGHEAVRDTEKPGVVFSLNPKAMFGLQKFMNTDNKDNEMLSFVDRSIENIILSFSNKIEEIVNRINTGKKILNDLKESYKEEQDESIKISLSNKIKNTENKISELQRSLPNIYVPEKTEVYRNQPAYVDLIRAKAAELNFPEERVITYKPDFADVKEGFASSEAHGSQIGRQFDRFMKNGSLVVKLDEIMMNKLQFGYRDDRETTEDAEPIIREIQRLSKDVNNIESKKEIVRLKNLIPSVRNPENVVLNERNPRYSTDKPKFIETHIASMDFSYEKINVINTIKKQISNLESNISILRGDRTLSKKDTEKLADVDKKKLKELKLVLTLYESMKAGDSLYEAIIKEATKGQRITKEFLNKNLTDKQKNTLGITEVTDKNLSKITEYYALEKIKSNNFEGVLLKLKELLIGNEKTEFEYAENNKQSIKLLNDLNKNFIETKDNYNKELEDDPYRKKLTNKELMDQTLDSMEISKAKRLLSPFKETIDFLLNKTEIKDYSTTNKDLSNLKSTSISSVPDAEKFINTVMQDIYRELNTKYYVYEDLSKETQDRFLKQWAGEFVYREDKSIKISDFIQEKKNSQQIMFSELPVNQRIIEASKLFDSTVEKAIKVITESSNRDTNSGLFTKTGEFRGQSFDLTPKVEGTTKEKRFEQADNFKFFLGQITNKMLDMEQSWFRQIFSFVENMKTIDNQTFARLKPIESVEQKIVSREANSLIDQVYTKENKNKLKNSILTFDDLEDAISKKQINDIEIPNKLVNKFKALAQTKSQIQNPMLKVDDFKRFIGYNENMIKSVHKLTSAFASIRFANEGDRQKYVQDVNNLIKSVESFNEKEFGLPISFEEYKQLRIGTPVKAGKYARNPQSESAVTPSNEAGLSYLAPLKSPDEIVKFFNKLMKYSGSKDTISTQLLPLYTDRTYSKTSPNASFFETAIELLISKGRKTFSDDASLPDTDNNFTKREIEFLRGLNWATLVEYIDKNFEKDAPQIIKAARTSYAYEDDEGNLIDQTPDITSVDYDLLEKLESNIDLNEVVKNLVFMMRDFGNIANVNFNKKFRDNIDNPMLMSLQNVDEGNAAYEAIESDLAFDDSIKTEAIKIAQRGIGHGDLYEKHLGSKPSRTISEQELKIGKLYNDFYSIKEQELKNLSKETLLSISPIEYDKDRDIDINRIVFDIINDLFINENKVSIPIEEFVKHKFPKLTELASKIDDESELKKEAELALKTEIENEQARRNSSYFLHEENQNKSVYREKDKVKEIETYYGEVSLNLNNEYKKFEQEALNKGLVPSLNEFLAKWITANKEFNERKTIEEAAAQREIESTRKAEINLQRQQEVAKHRASREQALSDADPNIVYMKPVIPAKDRSDTSLTGIKQHDIYPSFEDRDDIMSTYPENRIGNKIQSIDRITRFDFIGSMLPQTKGQKEAYEKVIVDLVNQAINDTATANESIVQFLKSNIKNIDDIKRLINIHDKELNVVDIIQSKGKTTPADRQRIIDATDIDTGNQLSFKFPTSFVNQLKDILSIAQVETPSDKGRPSLDFNVLKTADLSSLDQMTVKDEKISNIIEGLKTKLMAVFASEDAIVNKLESFTKATKWASKHPEYGGIDDVLKMLREQLPSHTEQKTQLSETIQRIENYLAIEKKIREVKFLIKGLKDKDSEENKITSQIVKQAAIQMPNVKPKVIEENLIKNLTDSLDELKTAFDSARLETIEYVEKAKQITPTQEYYAPRDADDSVNRDYDAEFFKMVQEYKEGIHIVTLFWEIFDKKSKTTPFEELDNRALLMNKIMDRWLDIESVDAIQGKGKEVIAELKRIAKYGEGQKYIPIEYEVSDELLNTPRKKRSSLEYTEEEQQILLEEDNAHSITKRFLRDTGNVEGEWSGLYEFDSKEFSNSLYYQLFKNIYGKLHDNQTAINEDLKEKAKLLEYWNDNIEGTISDIQKTIEVFDNKKQDAIRDRNEELFEMYENKTNALQQGIKDLQKLQKQRDIFKDTGLTVERQNYVFKEYKDKFQGSNIFDVDRLKEVSEMARKAGDTTALIQNAFKDRPDNLTDFIKNKLDTGKYNLSDYYDVSKLDSARIKEIDEFIDNFLNSLKAGTAKIKSSDAVSSLRNRNQEEIDRLYFASDRSQELFDALDSKFFRPAIDSIDNTDLLRRINEFKKTFEENYKITDITGDSAYGKIRNIYSGMSSRPMYMQREMGRNRELIDTFENKISDRIQKINDELETAIKIIADLRSANLRVDENLIRRRDLLQTRLDELNDFSTRLSMFQQTGMTPERIQHLYDVNPDRFTTDASRLDPELLRNVDVIARRSEDLVGLSSEQVRQARAAQRGTTYHDRNSSYYMYQRLLGSFATFGMTMSGIAATLFVWQQASMWVQNLFDSVNALQGSLLDTIENFDLLSMSTEALKIFSDEYINSIRTISVEMGVLVGDLEEAIQATLRAGLNIDKVKDVYAVEQSGLVSGYDQATQVVSNPYLSNFQEAYQGRFEQRKNTLIGKWNTAKASAFDIASHIVLTDQDIDTSSIESYESKIKSVLTDVSELMVGHKQTFLEYFDAIVQALKPFYDSYKDYIPEFIDLISLLGKAFSYLIPILGELSPLLAVLAGFGMLGSIFLSVHHSLIKMNGAIKLAYDKLHLLAYSLYEITMVANTAGVASTTFATTLATAFTSIKAALVPIGWAVAAIAGLYLAFKAFDAYQDMRKRQKARNLAEELKLDKINLGTMSKGGRDRELYRLTERRDQLLDEIALIQKQIKNFENNKFVSPNKYLNNQMLEKQKELSDMEEGIKKAEDQIKKTSNELKLDIKDLAVPFEDVVKFLDKMEESFGRISESVFFQRMTELKEQLQQSLEIAGKLKSEKEQKDAADLANHTYLVGERETKQKTLSIDEQREIERLKAEGIYNPDNIWTDTSDENYQKIQKEHQNIEIWNQEINDLKANVANGVDKSIIDKEIEKRKSAISGAEKIIKYLEMIEYIENYTEGLKAIQGLKQENASIKLTDVEIFKNKMKTDGIPPELTEEYLNQYRKSELEKMKREGFPLSAKQADYEKEQRSIRQIVPDNQTLQNKFLDQARYTKNIETIENTLERLNESGAAASEILRFETKKKIEEIKLSGSKEIFSPKDVESKIKAAYQKYDFDLKVLDVTTNLEASKEKDISKGYMSDETTKLTAELNKLNLQGKYILDHDALEALTKQDVQAEEIARGGQPLSQDEISSIMNESLSRQLEPLLKIKDYEAELDQVKSKLEYFNQLPRTDENINILKALSQRSIELEGKISNLPVEQIEENKRIQEFNSSNEPASNISKEAFDMQLGELDLSIAERYSKLIQDGFSDPKLFFDNFIKWQGGLTEKKYMELNREADTEANRNIYGEENIDAALVVDELSKYSFDEVLNKGLQLFESYLLTKDQITSDDTSVLKELLISKYTEEGRQKGLEGGLNGEIKEREIYAKQETEKHYQSLFDPLGNNIKKLSENLEVLATYGEGVSLAQGYMSDEQVKAEHGKYKQTLLNTYSTQEMTAKYKPEELKELIKKLSDKKLNSLTIEQTKDQLSYLEERADYENNINEITELRQALIEKEIKNLGLTDKAAKEKYKRNADFINEQKDLEDTKNVWEDFYNDRGRMIEAHYENEKKIIDHTYDMSTASDELREYERSEAMYLLNRQKALANGGMSEGVTAFFTDLSHEMESSAQFWYDMMYDINSELANGFSDIMFNAIKGRETDFAEMFEGIGDSLLSKFTNKLSEVFVKENIMQPIGSFLTSIGAASQEEIDKATLSSQDLLIQSNYALIDAINVLSGRITGTKTLESGSGILGSLSKIAMIYSAFSSGGTGGKIAGIGMTTDLLSGLLGKTEFGKSFGGAIENLGKLAGGITSAVGLYQSIQNKDTMGTIVSGAGVLKNSADLYNAWSASQSSFTKLGGADITLASEPAKNFLGLSQEVTQVLGKTASVLAAAYSAYNTFSTWEESSDAERALNVGATAAASGSAFFAVTEGLLNPATMPLAIAAGVLSLLSGSGLFASKEHPAVYGDVLATRSSDKSKLYDFELSNVDHQDWDSATSDNLKYAIEQKLNGYQAIFNLLDAETQEIVKEALPETIEGFVRFQAESSTFRFDPFAEKMTEAFADTWQKPFLELMTAHKDLNNGVVNVLKSDIKSIVDDPSSITSLDTASGTITDLLQAEMAWGQFTGNLTDIIFAQKQTTQELLDKYHNLLDGAKAIDTSLVYKTVDENVKKSINTQADSTFLSSDYKTIVNEKLETIDSGMLSSVEGLEQYGTVIQEVTDIINKAEEAWDNASKTMKELSGNSFISLAETLESVNEQIDATIMSMTSAGIDNSKISEFASKRDEIIAYQTEQYNNDIINQWFDMLDEINGLTGDSFFNLERVIMSVNQTFDEMERTLIAAGAGASELEGLNVLRDKAISNQTTKSKLDFGYQLTGIDTGFVLDEIWSGLQDSTSKSSEMIGDSGETFWANITNAGKSADFVGDIAQKMRNALATAAANLTMTKMLEPLLVTALEPITSKGSDATTDDYKLVGERVSQIDLQSIASTGASVFTNAGGKIEVSYVDSTSTDDTVDKTADFIKKIQDEINSLTMSDYDYSIQQVNDSIAEYIKEATELNIYNDDMKNQIEQLKQLKLDEIFEGWLDTLKSIERLQITASNSDIEAFEVKESRRNIAEMFKVSEEDISGLSNDDIMNAFISISADEWGNIINKYGIHSDEFIDIMSGFVDNVKAEKEALKDEMTALNEIAKAKASLNKQNTTIFDLNLSRDNLNQTLKPVGNFSNFSNEQIIDAIDKLSIDDITNIAKAYKISIDDISSATTDFVSNMQAQKEHIDAMNDYFKSYGNISDTLSSTMDSYSSAIDHYLEFVESAKELGTESQLIASSINEALEPITSSFMDMFNEIFELSHSDIEIETNRITKQTKSLVDAIEFLSSQGVFALNGLEGFVEGIYSVGEKLLEGKKKSLVRNSLSNLGDVQAEISGLSDEYKLMTLSERYMGDTTYFLDADKRNDFLTKASTMKYDEVLQFSINSNIPIETIFNDMTTLSSISSQLSESFKDVKEALEDYRKSLLISDESYMNPKQKTDIARAEFLKLSQEALSTDPKKAQEAMNKLPDAAKTLLDLSKKSNTSMLAYNTDMGLVLTSLQKAEKSAKTYIGNTEDMTDEQEDTLRELQKGHLEKISKGLISLDKEVAAIFDDPELVKFFSDFSTIFGTGVMNSLTGNIDILDKTIDEFTEKGILDLEELKSLLITGIPLSDADRTLLQNMKIAWDGDAAIDFWASVAMDFQGTFEEAMWLLGFVYNTSNQNWNAPAVVGFIQGYDEWYKIGNITDIMAAIGFLGDEAGWESPALVSFVGNTSLWSKVPFNDAMAGLAFIYDSAGKKWTATAVVSFIQGYSGWNAISFIDKMAALNFLASESEEKWNSEAVLAFTSNDSAFGTLTVSNALTALKMTADGSGGWGTKATVSMMSTMIDSDTLKWTDIIPKMKEYGAVDDTVYKTITAVVGEEWAGLLDSLKGYGFTTEQVGKTIDAIIDNQWIGLKDSLIGYGFTTEEVNKTINAIASSDWETLNSYLTSKGFTPDQVDKTITAVKKDWENLKQYFIDNGFVSETVNKTIDAVLDSEWIGLKTSLIGYGFTNEQIGKTINAIIDNKWFGLKDSLVGYGFTTEEVNKTINAIASSDWETLKTYLTTKGFTTESVNKTIAAVKKDWEGLEQYFIDNGFVSETVSKTIDAVLDSEWIGLKTSLIGYGFTNEQIGKTINAIIDNKWFGLKDSLVGYGFTTEEVNKTINAIASSDWETLKTYLTTKGFTTESVNKTIAAVKKDWEGLEQYFIDNGFVSETVNKTITAVYNSNNTGLTTWADLSTALTKAGVDDTAIKTIQAAWSSSVTGLTTWADLSTALTKAGIDDTAIKTIQAAWSSSVTGLTTWADLSTALGIKGGTENFIKSLTATFINNGMTIDQAKSIMQSWGVSDTLTATVTANMDMNIVSNDLLTETTFNDFAKAFLTLSTTSWTATNKPSTIIFDKGTPEQTYGYSIIDAIWYLSTVITGMSTTGTGSSTGTITSSGAITASGSITSSGTIYASGSVYASTSTGAISATTSWGAINVSGTSVNFTFPSNMSSLPVTISNWKGIVGSDAMNWAVFTSGLNSGLKAISQNLSDIKNPNVTSTTVWAGTFAQGGYHSGGLRLVGELGPELEVTGAARYYSTKDTLSMLSDLTDVQDSPNLTMPTINIQSNDTNNDELIEEIRNLKNEIVELKRNSKEQLRITTKQYEIIDRQDNEGIPPERVN